MCRALVRLRLECDARQKVCSLAPRKLANIFKPLEQASAHAAVSTRRGAMRDPEQPSQSLYASSLRRQREAVNVLAKTKLSKGTM